MPPRPSDIRRHPLLGPPGDGIVRTMSSLPGVPSAKVPATKASAPKTPRPLSPDELAHAERVAARLHSEFRALVIALPEHARGASGMARHLGVLRATCQRVAAVVHEPTASADSLTRLPGLEGLAQFLAGARGAGLDAALVESAQSAVEQFEQLLIQSGGSQSKLADRLAATAGRATAAAGHLASAAQREALYRAAIAVTGRACETALSIYAFRVKPGVPDTLQRALAKGLIGSVLHPGGMPMVLSSGDTLAADDDPEHAMLLNREPARGRIPEAILRPFTTDPLPTVTGRSRKGSLIQIIDPRTAETGTPIDVVTAVRGDHPLFDPQGRPTLDAVWSLNNCPTARLIFDVYLHQDMERVYRPSLDAQMWNPGLTLSEEDRWVTRFPSVPKLQLLGRGIDNAASDLYPRHAELTRYFFDHVGWDAEDFVGFRCEVQWPVWRGGYVIAFEYLASGSAPAPQ